MNQLSFNKLLLCFLCLLAPSLVFSKECSEIRKIFLSEVRPNELEIKEFEKGVAEDNLCFKNLMGVLFYEGKFFDKNQKRAEQIFYDLSNKNYPEAQFNFAWTMTKRDDQNPENVVTLLLGIFSKYVDDPINSHLASKTRDLGRLYIEELRQKNINCSKDSKCPPFYKSLSYSKIEEMKNAFELNIKDATFKAAGTFLENKRLEEDRVRERDDIIIGILSLGMLAYSLSSSPRTVSPRANIPSGGTNPWFNYGQGFGNPLNLYQFHL